MQALYNLLDFLGRLLIAPLFIPAGVNKIGGFAGTQQYMESQGVPGDLLPLVIAVEIIAPIMIILGWWTRLAAFGLAVFTILSAALFHFDLADQAQYMQFMKNLAIGGGLLILAGRGAGGWSMDGRQRD